MRCCATRYLTVVELRQGTTVRHGIELYRHCQRQVELVRERFERCRIQSGERWST